MDNSQWIDEKSQKRLLYIGVQDIYDHLEKWKSS